VTAEVSDADVVTARTRFGTLLCHARDEYITPSLLARGIWEPAETAYLGWRLRPGMRFVDVGAHVGYYTVLAARSVGASGEVIAFEPDPANRALLERNVALNDCANVRVLPWAAGARAGRVILHRARFNTGDHRVYAAGGDREALEVGQVLLDEVPALAGPVDVVKIDVQGAEEGVVRGMEALVARSPGVVVLAEYWPAALERFGSAPGALLGYYRSLGFRLEVQHPGRPFPVPLVDDALAAEAAAGGEDWQVTLVMTRPVG
jgi:FkbM family methyltransferase